MKNIIFFFISMSIFMGAFLISRRFFGDGDTAMFIGVLAGGICFFGFFG